MRFFIETVAGTSTKTNCYGMVEKYHRTIGGDSWYSREYECPICKRRFMRKVQSWWAERGRLCKYRRCRNCEGVVLVRGVKPRKVKEGHKYCKYCKEIKALCLFHKDRSSRDGMSGRCCECSKKKRKAYYDAHRDAEKKAASEWGRKHRDSRRMANARHRAKNKRTDTPDIRPIKADAK